MDAPILLSVFTTVSHGRYVFIPSEKGILVAYILDESDEQKFSEIPVAGAIYTFQNIFGSITVTEKFYDIKTIKKYNSSSEAVSKVGEFFMSFVGSKLYKEEVKPIVEEKLWTRPDECSSPPKSMLSSSTRQKPENSGKRWSPHDILKLKEYVDEGMAYEMMASLLGRTANAVKIQIDTLTL